MVYVFQGTVGVKRHDGDGEVALILADGVVGVDVCRPLAQAGRDQAIGVRGDLEDTGPDWGIRPHVGERKWAIPLPREGDGRASAEKSGSRWTGPFSRSTSFCARRSIEPSKCII